MKGKDDELDENRIKKKWTFEHLYKHWVLRCYNHTCRSTRRIKRCLKKPRKTNTAFQSDYSFSRIHVFIFYYWFWEIPSRDENETHMAQMSQQETGGDSTHVSRLNQLLKMIDSLRFTHDRWRAPFSLCLQFALKLFLQQLRFPLTLNAAWKFLREGSPALAKSASFLSTARSVEAQKQKKT